MSALRGEADRSISDLPTLYIDEKAGSDTEGNGSSLSPFATPLGAYQSLSPLPVSDPSPSLVANFMVRKADSVERNEWVELSASAKKKLVKNIEGWRKKEAKLAKEGERLEQEKKGAEERDRVRREEAKSIVLVDDASKGDAKKVSPQLNDYVSVTQRRIKADRNPEQMSRSFRTRWISSQTTRMGTPIPTSKDQLLHSPPRRYSHDPVYPHW